jgi:hypothetical protein
MISKIIVQTSRFKPDKYIVDLFAKYAPGWEYRHFTDSEIIDFFKDNSDDEFPNIIDKFNSIPYGQHKADLFRYYFLYICGGVFIDSDAMLNVPIEEVIKNYEFFTVSSDHIKNSIFQGFIGACPKNAIIYKALVDAYTVDVDALTREFHLLCRNLYKIIYEFTYDFTFKIYNEGNYNEAATKTYDRKEPDKNLLFHYYRYKIIPKNGPNEIIKPLIIVTPCSRPQNLEKLRESIQFDNPIFIYWVIIYDTRKMPFIKRYPNHNKILELECRDEGVVGHQIRNMAMHSIIQQGMIYFLDDDTILHPYFWTIVNNFKPNIVIYTFNLMYQNGKILFGNTPRVRGIDTCQFIFDKSIVGDLRFDTTDYCADGIFIQTLYEKNKEQAAFINSIAAYYNWLNKEQPLPIGVRM